MDLAIVPGTTGDLQDGFTHWSCGSRNNGQRGSGGENSGVILWQQKITVANEGL